MSDSVAVLQNDQNGDSDNQITGFGPQNLEDANTERQRQVTERQNLITALITEFGGLTVKAIVEKLDGSAKEWTVRSDCKELEAQGKIYKEGTKWHPTLTMGLPATTPPTPQPHVNGHTAPVAA